MPSLRMAHPSPTTAHCPDDKAHLMAPSGRPRACSTPPQPSAPELLPARQAQLPPRAPPSQNTAGAPNVYTGEQAEMGSTPRRTYMSISSVLRLPPREWPVNETWGRGTAASSRGSVRM